MWTTIYLFRSKKQAICRGKYIKHICLLKTLHAVISACYVMCEILGGMFDGVLQMQMQIYPGNHGISDIEHASKKTAAKNNCSKYTQLFIKYYLNTAKCIQHYF